MKALFVGLGCLVTLASGSVRAQGGADLAFAPPSFETAGVQAAFGDFESADYQIDYDLVNRKAWVVSTIHLKQGTPGRLLFDFVGEVLDARLDGQPVSAQEVMLPGNISRMKMLSASSEAGSHLLELRTELKALVRFERRGVKSAFWTSDLSDREYLEQYLPSNLEYDRVAVTLRLRFSGDASDQEVIANGTVRKTAAGEFTVQFPAFFTSSSIFFHTFPTGAFTIERAQFISVDGRTIPVLTYGAWKFLRGSALSRAAAIFQELERDYGPWPHPSLTIYLAGMGGMEYAGATMTSLDALGHEMFHSYHARSVLPANGDAGWMDEAIARWRDRGYRTRTAPGYSGAKLAGRSPYIRYTPMKAYDEGSWFMEYLASYFGSDAQGFKTFLRNYHEKHRYAPVTTELFRSEIETALARSFEADFSKFVYGEGQTRSAEESEGRQNPFHPKLTRQQLEAQL